jgi:hypothetical protein
MLEVEKRIIDKGKVSINQIFDASNLLFSHLSPFPTSLDEEDDPQWARGNKNVEKGLWDDIEGSSALELTDFAAAAEKFRRETKDAGFADSDFPAPEEDDPLERLLREEAALDASEENGGDEGMPEWADAAELDKSTFGDDLAIHTPAPQPSAASESKRSLLLGALNLKGPTTNNAATSPPSMLQNALLQQQQYHMYFPISIEA